MTEAENVFILFDADGFVNSGDREAFEHTLSVIGSLALKLSQRHYQMGFATNCVVSGQEPGTFMLKRKSEFLEPSF